MNPRHRNCISNKFVHVIRTSGAHQHTQGGKYIGTPLGNVTIVGQSICGLQLPVGGVCACDMWGWFDDCVLVVHGVYDVGINIHGVN